MSTHPTLSDLAAVLEELVELRVREDIGDGEHYRRQAAYERAQRLLRAWTGAHQPPPAEREGGAPARSGTMADAYGCGVCRAMADDLVDWAMRLERENASPDVRAKLGTLIEAHAARIRQR